MKNENRSQKNVFLEQNLKFDELNEDDYAE